MDPSDPPNTAFSDHNQPSSPPSPSQTQSSRHTISERGAPAAAPFQVPRRWREAMQCVSVNAGLHPAQILHRYHALFAAQSAAHPGHVELDVWRAKRAAGRGIRSVHVRYLDGDPEKIYLLVILVAADGGGGGGSPPVVRLVTNTSARHVLEAPYADCPAWLPVRPGGSSPYHIIPCCERWAGSADFGAPMSDEERLVPEVVSGLVAELRRRDLLLHAREREVEAKDDQLQRLRGASGSTAGAPRPPSPMSLHSFDLETLECYWWASAVLAIVLVVWLVR